MPRSPLTSNLRLQGVDLSISGRFPRLLKLRAEGYETITDPSAFLAAVAAAKLPADLCTFLDPIGAFPSAQPYRFTAHAIAALKVDTYEKWWTDTINVKTRNMVRKALKKGVQTKVLPFDDELVRAIKALHDEAPIRQGKPFTHYGKDFATVKQDHLSFLERSTFIGAVYEDRLIGFIKLVDNGASMGIMQIISFIAHRDKAPTNALLAKAVEICAEKRIPYLTYGVWSRRSFGDFKRHHGFERLDIRRYFVPLNFRGHWALALGMQRPLAARLPDRWIDFLVEWRARWYERRAASPSSASGAVAQSAERPGFGQDDGGSNPSCSTKTTG